MDGYLNLGLDELLMTTRSVRKRLDLGRPVPRELITECLDVAFQAPNGSNQEHWDWIVIDDPDLRLAVAEIYRGGMQDQIDRVVPPGGPRADYTRPGQPAISSSVMHLREHLHQVPALLVPVIPWRMDNATIFLQASLWGSILPAVWNFMLALRARGLGSAWTTIHLHREQAMAELLGIPFDTHTQAGLFPIAWTVGTDFKAASRTPAADTVRWNSWGGQPT
jgi:nitroreductase